MGIDGAKGDTGEKEKQVIRCHREQLWVQREPRKATEQDGINGVEWEQPVLTGSKQGAAGNQRNLMEQLVLTGATGTNGIEWKCGTKGDTGGKR